MGSFSWEQGGSQGRSPGEERPFQERVTAIYTAQKRRSSTELFGLSRKQLEGWIVIGDANESFYGRSVGHREVDLNFALESIKIGF